MKKILLIIVLIIAILAIFWFFLQPKEDSFDGIECQNNLVCLKDAAKKSLDNKIDYELMETVFLADENQMLENDLNYQSKPFIPDENKTPPINPPPKTDDWIYLIAGFILVLVVAVAYGFMKKKK